MAGVGCSPASRSSKGPCTTFFRMPMMSSASFYLSTSSRNIDDRDD